MARSRLRMSPMPSIKPSSTARLADQKAPEKTSGKVWKNSMVGVCQTPFAASLSNSLAQFDKSKVSTVSPVPQSPNTL